MSSWLVARASRGVSTGKTAGLQGGLIQRLRLWSGLVLMLFAATHLANHTVGLWSLADMEAVRLWFTGFWRSMPMTVVVLAATTAHICLAIWKLILGKTWRLPWWQWAQIGLGFAIPLFLTEHLLGTRIAHEVFGMEDKYAFVLLVTWPGKNWDMVWLMAVVWLHGCIGVHYWARLYPVYSRLRLWLGSVALLLPFLAYTGYASAGREVARLSASDRFWSGDLLRTIKFPGQPGVDFVVAGTQAAEITLATVAAGIVLVRLVRYVLAVRGGITVTYPGNLQFRVPRGITVLEASRQAGVPHAAVCGGRGRCSTCRVRLGRGAERLAEPSEAEARVLQRIAAPPGIRLACQIPVTAALDIIPLLPPFGGSSPSAGDEMGNRYGRERELAVLFCDIRGFTSFSEHRLPYDVIFILNRYFRAMSEEIQANGGYVDKFIGDGLMALFGLEVDNPAACRQAVSAVRAMSAHLDVLNQELANELGEPLRIGIGVHSGLAIVGELGHGRAASLTAIGDTVNVASRLEMMTKEYACEAVISQEVADAAGIKTASLRHADLPIRGRSQPLSAVLAPRGSDLPALD